MYDGACLSEPVLSQPVLSAPARLQRAVGELRVSCKQFGAETTLDELRQAGCLKARFPRRLTQGWLDAVTLNTGGGVAGGDCLDLTVTVGPGARATVAAQAAERIYRALAADSPSRIRTHLTVGNGATLEWLPQETILFDRCSLDRRLDIDLAPDARFLGVETLVFGRTAMGEQVRQGRLRDLIRLRRDNSLLLHDAIRLDGEISTLLQRPAIAAGAAAVATMVYAAPDATTKLDPVRTALGLHEAGASVWNGMLVARILGSDGAAVRRKLVAALHILRDARPLPRVWLC
jgi:urease accessory protein